MSTRFILVRHGETASSVERRFAGSTDVGLTDAGLEQARALARRLRPVRIDAMFCSPLRRCLETAAPITEATGRKPVIADDIHECRFGDWENKTVAEILETWGDEFRTWLADETICPPNGESWFQLGERVKRWYEEALTRYENRTVLAVTHGGPIIQLARHVTNASRETAATFFVDVASVSVVQVADGRTRIRVWNDTSHFREPLLETDAVPSYSRTTLDERSRPGDRVIRSSDAEEGRDSTGQDAG